MRHSVALGPNCPTMAGATMATTLSPRRMARPSWKICDLSAMAPNGQLTMHWPQPTHFLGSMEALPRGSLEIALTPHASAQGRTLWAMASYGQAALHLPHLMHFSRSMTVLPSFPMEMAPLGQTAMHARDTQPRHWLLTS